MWLDLQAEVADVFAVLEGCGVPLFEDGFGVWDPEKKLAERAEAARDPFFAVKRHATRPKYRENENRAARAYRLANREEINRRRREAYAAKKSHAAV